MAITLNGTTGIQNVLGSAAAPAESNTTSSNTGVYFPTSTSVGIATAGVQAINIDASQNFGVRTTSVYATYAALSVNGYIGSSTGYLCHAGTGAGTTFGNAFNLNFSGSATSLWIDATNTGTITVVSDYRIKKNVDTQTANAVNRILQLRPVTYELTDYKIFKSDNVAREGFIAHELQAVIPSAVEGEKDDPDQIQSLKLDALCSVMVKAIQELTARIEALEAK